MLITDNQGRTIEVKRDNYNGRPCIVFGYPPRCYLFETFMEIQEGEGLCVDGHKFDYCSISPETVEKCKEWIRPQLEGGYGEVLLVSQEFGTESFEYGSASEAREGMKRLLEKAKAETAIDGVRREVILCAERSVIDPEEED